MRAYQFFIDDDRYKVATLMIELASDDQHAREVAEALVARSPHYARVRVFHEDGTELLGVSKKRTAA
jgi:hypothetical protein